MDHKGNLVFRTYIRKSSLNEKRIAGFGEFLVFEKALFLEVIHVEGEDPVSHWFF
jgi:hypothetical protein